MFFNGWIPLARTAVVGLLAYLGLILLLRMSGKRTLSKMNAFDLIVTVALGSILATILLSKDVALAQGLVAFTLLIFLQFAITWLSVRSTTISKLVKADPTLLFYRGQFLEDNLRRERVVKTEINAALRSQGYASFEEVEAVVLETDGTFTAIPTTPGETRASALDHVSRKGL